MTDLAPRYWSPIMSTDNMLRYFDLTTWFLPGDVQVGTPAITIVPIVGDTSPLTVSAEPIWDTGPKSVAFSPGVTVVSAGPRIALMVTGGTPGQTYQVQVQFTDTFGQTKTIIAFQDVN